MAYRPCPTPGCPEILQQNQRCTRCRKASDRRRRPTGNPYTTPGHQRFREAVLARHPHCVCTGDCGRQHNGQCNAPSTIADHYPTERADLITQGLDPNDPQHGRGLCTSCHNRKTARTRRGGWFKRTSEPGA